jgi:hypothetical protein
MMATTGALLGGLAVIAVALEATGPAIVLGGVDDHALSVKGCTNFPTGPLWSTGTLLRRAGSGDFKISAFQLPPLPR